MAEFAPPKRDPLDGPMRIDRAMGQGFREGIQDNVDMVKSIPALAKAIWEGYPDFARKYPTVGHLAWEMGKAYYNMDPVQRQDWLDAAGQVVGGTAGGIAGGLAGSGLASVPLAAAGGGGGAVAGDTLAKVFGPLLGAEGMDWDQPPEEYARHLTRTATANAIPELVGGAAGSALRNTPRAMGNLAKGRFTPGPEVMARNAKADAMGFELPLEARIDEKGKTAVALLNYLPGSRQLMQGGRRSVLQQYDTRLGSLADDLGPPSTDPVEVLRDPLIQRRAGLQSDLDAIQSRIPDVDASQAVRGLKGARDATLESISEVGDEMYRPILERWGAAQVDTAPIAAAAREAINSEAAQNALGLLDGPTRRILERATSALGDQVGEAVQRNPIRSTSGSSARMTDELGRPIRRAPQSGVDPLGRPVRQPPPVTNTGSRTGSTPSGRTYTDPLGRPVSRPTTIPLAEWKVMRSELMKRRRKLVEAGFDERALGRLIDSFNEAAEVSLPPDAAAALKEANAAWKTIQDSANPPVNPNATSGNPAAGMITRNMDNDPGTLRRVTDTRNPERIDQLRSATTPFSVEGGGLSQSTAGGPGFDDYRAGATRELFIRQGMAGDDPFTSPRLIRDAVERGGRDVAERLGFGPEIDEMSAPAMVQRERDLYNSPLSRMATTDGAAPATRMRAVSRNPDLFEQAMDLAGDNADVLRRGYLDSLMDPSKRKVREAGLVDQPIVHPDIFREKLRSAGPVGDIAFRGKENIRQSLEDVADIGRGALKVEMTEGNPSGTAVVGANLAALAAAGEAVSRPSPRSFGALGLLTAIPMFAAGGLARQPGVARFLTTPKVPMVRPGPITRTATATMRVPMYVRPDEQETPALPVFQPDPPAALPVFR